MPQWSGGRLGCLRSCHPLFAANRESVLVWRGSDCGGETIRNGRRWRIPSSSKSFAVGKRSLPSTADWDKTIIIVRGGVNVNALRASEITNHGIFTDR